MNIGALAASLVLAAALPAFAADVGGAAENAGEAIGNAGKATGHVVKEGAEATKNAVTGAVHGAGKMLGITRGEQVTAAEAARYDAAPHKSECRLSGTVSDIDRDDGMVQLSTADGLLKLPFKPDSIQGLNEGDRATAQLAFVKLPVAGAAGDQPEGGMQSAGAEHWMKGTVRHLDRRIGRFDLDTGDTTARLQFEPAQVVSLNDGDTVAVQVGLLTEQQKQR